MKSHFWGRVRTCFLLGLVLSMPMIASIWVFNWILKITTGWFPRRFFPELPIPQVAYEKFIQVVLILVFMFLVFAAIGWLAQQFFGRRLYKLTDLIFSRVPVVKTIYLFTRQVCEWVAKRKTSVFQEVVLIEYPRRGIFSVAFVTATLPPHSPITQALAKARGISLEELGEVVNLFVATTPNPTSGIYLVVPRGEVIATELDTLTAINMVMSAGAISPTAKAAKTDADPIGDLLKTWEESPEAPCACTDETSDSPGET